MNMNGRKAKQIRKKARGLLVQWMWGVLPQEEDKDSVNEKTILSLLSPQTHLYTDGRMRLSPFSYKWTAKQVKRRGVKDLQSLMKRLHG